MERLWKQQGTGSALCFLPLSLAGAWPEAALHSSRGQADPRPCRSWAGSSAEACRHEGSRSWSSELLGPQTGASPSGDSPGSPKGPAAEVPWEQQALTHFLCTANTFTTLELPEGSMHGLVHHQAYWKAGYIYMLKLQILLQ